MHITKYLVLFALLIHFPLHANLEDSAALRDKHFMSITTLDNALLEYEHRQRNGYPLSVEGKDKRREYQKEDYTIKKFIEFQENSMKYPTLEYYPDAKTINRKLVDQLFDSYFTAEQANELRARVLDKGDTIPSVYAITLVVERVTPSKKDQEKVLQDIFISTEFVKAYMRATISFKKYVEQVSNYYLDRQIIH